MAGNKANITVAIHSLSCVHLCKTITENDFSAFG